MTKYPERARARRTLARRLRGLVYRLMRDFRTPAAELYRRAEQRLQAMQSPPIAPEESVRATDVPLRKDEPNANRRS
jgi:hypothetical protein